QLIRRTFQRRARELAPELRRQLRVVVAERDGADAARGGGDEQPPERRADHAVMDGLARASSPIRCWCHAELLACTFVHAAARAVAGLERRAADGVAGAQALLQSLGAPRAHVLARRHA